MTLGQTAVFPFSFDVRHRDPFIISLHVRCLGWEASLKNHARSRHFDRYWEVSELFLHKVRISALFSITFTHHGQFWQCNILFLPNLASLLLQYASKKKSVSLRTCKDFQKLILWIRRTNSRDNIIFGLITSKYKGKLDLSVRAFLSSQYFTNSRKFIRLNYEFL